uniref:Uncharacterized protein n=1 Tax=Anguilla anguilla TaxID=7936 RepID=A0A0E9TNU1_ANGAN
MNSSPVRAFQFAPGAAPYCPSHSAAMIPGCLPVMWRQMWKTHPMQRNPGR